MDIFTNRSSSVIHHICVMLAVLNASTMVSEMIRKVWCWLISAHMADKTIQYVYHSTLLHSIALRFLTRKLICRICKSVTLMQTGRSFRADWFINPAYTMLTGLPMN